MCLHVDPSGLHDGMGTYVSVFTCIMRGPFDDCLKWPFRGDITIRMMNQVGGSDNHEGIIPYTDQTPHTLAKKVTNAYCSLSWA